MKKLLLVVALSIFGCPAETPVPQFVVDLENAQKTCEQKGLVQIEKDTLAHQPCENTVLRLQLLVATDPDCRAYDAGVNILCRATDGGIDGARD